MRGGLHLAPILILCWLWVGGLLAGFAAGTMLVVAAALYLTVVVFAVAMTTVVGIAAALADAVLVLLRRILIACPHAASCGRFALPVYECPAEACSNRHRRLVPNMFGALRHMCLCGTSLPTTLLLGKYRLVAYCPTCDQPLPGRIGTIRVEHLPLVGGSATGKTTLMHLILRAMQQHMARSRGRLDFVDHWDEKRLKEGLAILDKRGRLPPTQSRLPTAVMVDLLPRWGSGHILYFFDPPGEIYHQISSMVSQEYLLNARALILVVDPFTIATVTDRLTSEEFARVASQDPAVQISSSRDNPSQLVDRLVAQFFGKKKMRIALVVTKTDAVQDTAVGSTLNAENVEKWLADIGLEGVLRILKNHAASIHCFASGLDASDDQLTSIVDWCIGGLESKKTRPLPVLARLAGGRGRIPWRPRGEGRETSLANRLWRLASLSTQIAAAVLVPVALGAGLFRLLFGG
jgi:hypothetical protein